MSNAETHFPPLSSAVRGQRLHAAAHLLHELGHTLSVVCRGGASAAQAAFHKVFREGGSEDGVLPLDATAARVADTGLIPPPHRAGNGVRERTTARAARCGLHDNEPAVNGTGLCAYHLAQKLKAQRGDKAGTWPDVTP